MTEFSVYHRALQKEQEASFKMHVPKEALRYLTEWAYWHGASNMYEVCQKYSGETSRWYPHQQGYDSMKISWYSWYGSIRFHITDRHGIAVSKRPELESFTVVSSKTWIIAESVSYVAAIINQFALTMFPGLTIHRNYCMCDGPHERPHNTFCQPIGDKWLCEECVSRYLLSQEKVSPLKQETSFAKAERAKMTPSLRFAMLQRDAFTCRGCGRSPLRNEEVVLCVDHIHPVSLGGKTEPSNLQTLCFDCNSGKSNKLAPEMAREVA